MYKIFLYSVFIGVSLLSPAQQNLVPNPSFEKYDSCPDFTSILYPVRDWYSPTVGTPNYYHSCGDVPASVPGNIYGYQEAYDGNAYVGLGVYYLTTNSILEYIQCKLLFPLQPNKAYKLTFYVSLADSISNYAISNLGAWLSDTAYVDTSSFPINMFFINASPQITAGYYLTDMKNWMEINSRFIAQGGEEYLTIGCFVPSWLNTDTVFVKDSWTIEPISYYYIDMISLIEDPCQDSLFLPNVFTPNGDGVNDTIVIALSCKSNTLINLIVFNRWGNVVYKASGEDKISWDGGKQPEGIYYYIIETTEKIYKGFVQLLR